MMYSLLSLVLLCFHASQDFRALQTHEYSCFILYLIFINPVSCIYTALVNSPSSPCLSHKQVWCSCITTFVNLYVSVGALSLDSLSLLFAYSLHMLCCHQHIIDVCVYVQARMSCCALEHESMYQFLVVLHSKGTSPPRAVHTGERATVAGADDCKLKMLLRLSARKGLHSDVHKHVASSYPILPHNIIFSPLSASSMCEGGKKRCCESFHTLEYGGPIQYLTRCVDILEMMYLWLENKE